MALIRIINPNSNSQVTEAMSTALEPLRMAGGPRLDCVTLEQGPPGIESQAHVSQVEPLLAQRIQSDNEADAFVIACYSDPGLHLCRELTTRPVLGIAECAILTAMTRGSCFGVISILHNSVARHRRHLRERRLDHLCAGDRPLGLSVAQVASGDNTYERMLTVGTALRDDDGAEVIIMGCAGMARHREPLQDALGMPVIDPTQAATSMAIGAVSLAR
ncbi:MAG: allantoin racemase [Gammaproteobacteria bacterium]|jgi:allantoin racemase